MSSESVRTFAENSPVQMAQVIAGLLAGRTVAQISETVGIPRARVLRWYRDSEEFQTMLDETSDAVVAQLRGEVVNEATEMVIGLAGKAAEVMGEMLEAEKESVRLAAAAHVLRFSGMGKPSGPARPSIEHLLKGNEGVSPAVGD